MAPLGLAYVGPDPDWYPSNPIKVSVEDEFYKATRKVLPWEPEAGGDDTMRQIPAAHLERLLRRVGVPDPEYFNPKLFMEKTLHIDFIAEALGTLVDNGLLDEEDDDGGEEAEAGERRPRRVHPVTRGERRRARFDGPSRVLSPFSLGPLLANVFPREARGVA